MVCWAVRVSESEKEPFRSIWLLPPPPKSEPAVSWVRTGYVTTSSTLLLILWKSCSVGIFVSFIARLSLPVSRFQLFVSDWPGFLLRSFAGDPKAKAHRELSGLACQF